MYADIVCTYVHMYMLYMYTEGQFVTLHNLTHLVFV